MAEKAVDNVLKNGAEIQRLPNRHLSVPGLSQVLEPVE
jgi:hypothetical protein